MSKNKKKQKRTMAQKADKFRCYQESVQTPQHEVAFFEQAYYEAYQAKPYRLREDFCGTFAICCHWVASNADRHAIGVDLCGETLQWGRDHNLAKLRDHQQTRVRILQQDVRKRNRPQADVLAAQNFSFWCFKTRKEVVDYFRVACSNLATQGVMVLDMMGGGECYDDELTDRRTIKKGKKGFKYYWQQAKFDPITADATFYIHFKFGDGSKLKKAFQYHWRFWTIPEVREMLAQAGFAESHVYWEGEDQSGQGDGTWSRCTAASSDPSWICYIVAIK